MNSNWKTVKIEDLGKIFTGHTPSKKDPTNFGGSYPWIKPTDITIGKRFVDDTEEKYSEKAYKKYRKYFLPPFSTCVVTIGTVGEKICLSKEPSFTNQSINAIIPDQNYYDPFFIYYLMKYNLPLVAKRNPGTASGRHHVSKSNFMSIEIKVPPTDIQKKIAFILRSFDDLFEVNLRRVGILEEMTRCLYEEWFIHLRYPGYENIETTQTPNGPIPKGWKLGPFTDIADVLSGGTPKTKTPEYWNGMIPFFTPRDKTNSFYVLQTEKNISELGLKKCNSDLFPKETIFITARGTVGETVLASKSMAMNQSCYALRGKKGIPQYFLFMLIRNQIDKLKKRAHGAVFDTIIVDTFRKLEIIVPTNDIIHSYNEIIQPIFEQINNLSIQNNLLKETRDLLLPKLISGEIDVSDIDIQL